MSSSRCWARVDTTRFSPKHRSENLRQQWGVDSDTRVMLYVGRLSPEKEVQLIVESYAAMQNIQQQKTKLVVVGDGPDLARLKALPEAKMLFLRVVCAGTIWQSHMQVPMSLYLQAKLKRLVT